MPMIGGDLAAMDALARRFDLAGSEFRTAAEALVHRAAEALDAYSDEMARLDRDARALDGEIGRTIAGLRGRADATTWSGTHRQRQDQALADLEADIARVRASIDGFLAQCAGVVGGALATSLTDVQQQVAATGARADVIATSFARGVAQQRQAFDLVLNG